MLCHVSQGHRGAGLQGKDEADKSLKSSCGCGGGRASQRARESFLSGGARSPYCCCFHQLFHLNSRCAASPDRRNTNTLLGGAALPLRTAHRSRDGTSSRKLHPGRSKTLTLRNHLSRCCCLLVALFAACRRHTGTCSRELSHWLLVESAALQPLTTSVT